MGIPIELIRATRERRIVPFVGAGVSVGVKPGLFPTWQALLEHLAVELHDNEFPEEARKVRQLIAAKDYLKAAESAHQHLGRYLFNGVLRRRFKQRRPSDGDFAVARGIWALEPSMVITTNYDDVLRWAGPPDVQVVANDQEEELALLSEASPEWPWLWHLHGTIQRLGTLILAGTDYRLLYGPESERAKQYMRAVFELHRMLASRPFLYVGFSLSDPYVIQQIEDVLKLTKGNNAPSYALMKKGEGAVAALRSNCNIHVVEYEDHGAPLAALLEELAAKAFGSSPPAMSRAVTVPVSQGRSPVAPFSATDASSLFEPAPPSISGKAAFVPRPGLEDEYAQELARSRRLLILAPRRGGARALTRRIAEERFGNRVTWLTPPRVPGCEIGEYLASLSDQPSMKSLPALEAWLRERASQLGGNHLIALRHDGGPIDHLRTVCDELRKLTEDRAANFFVVVPGGASSAWLRFNTPDASLFSGASARHVPSLSIEEVRAVLDNARADGGRGAEDVHRATGGHPGMLEEVLLSCGSGTDFDDMTARLVEGPTLHAVLRMRFTEDDHAGHPAQRHARATLRDLLAGRTVKNLNDIEDDLRYPEVRLYYDGLVVGGHETGGKTALRCEAVRLVVERTLALEDDA